MIIDKSLNYGRHLLVSFARTAAPFQVAVDLGAGGGGDLAAIRSVAPSSELHGVEIFPPYQQRMRESGISVHDLNLERDALPFQNESVDLLLMNQIMEHLKDIFWVLHEASRVLRVGGSLLIGVPNLGSLHNRLLLLANQQPTVINNSSAHVRGYTRRDFIHLLNAGHPDGYQLQQWGGSNFYPFPPFAARPIARLLPSLAWGLFMRFEKTKPYYDGFIRYPEESRLESNFYLGR
jgi:SAM-dependent methyltransferase